METIKAKIAGTEQEVMVDVDLEQYIKAPETPENKDERLNEFLNNLVLEYAKVITNKLGVDDLDEDELERMWEILGDENEYSTEDLEELARAVANSTLYNIMYRTVSNIVDERPRYFKYTVNYNGSFDVWVKAKSEDEARNRMDELTHYDFMDMEIDLYDADFDYDVPCTETSDEEPDGDNIVED